jgi:starvation-inducible DNA-binding protein
MPSSATVRTTLTDTARDQVTAALQPLLVDLVDLSLLAKQAHWTVTGPEFRSLHLQLDEITASTRLHSDRVAERLSTIGVVPDGRSASVAGTTRIAEFPARWIPGPEVVALVGDALQGIGVRAREAQQELGAVDPVSDDLLTEIIGQLEEHLWMLSVQER